MTTAKISEVFSSIQGEGKYAGVRQVFVRFYECNMRCRWCDTPYAIGDPSTHATPSKRGEFAQDSARRGKGEMPMLHKPGHFEEGDLEKLLAKVEELKPGCHSVSLTGGEPLVQKDFLKEFLPRLKKAGLGTYLETNGIMPDELREVAGDIDVVAMDLKLPSSTK